MERLILEAENGAGSGAHREFSPLQRSSLVSRMHSGLAHSVARSVRGVLQ